jgi:xylan 1,4-beta-xylosidase
VDISTLFPLFDADPEDPKNYTFAKTDDYLAAIVRNKGQIIYRLGESIEPWTHYHNHPPKDFSKWARICINVIRHYNEGWANGFHHNIKYWEIWNEPEIDTMWTGTRRQYFELYATAAKAIKAHDPSLKVGGPAATHVNSALVKPFLAWCRDQQVPLDFLSWHAYYGVPEALVNDAAIARKLLDEYGFRSTESHLNEWRYLTPWEGVRPSDPKEYTAVPEWFGRSCRAEGAAFCASVLMRLQDSPVDVANFYTADTSAWSMFGQFGIPTKVFYAFKAFSQLAALPKRVTCENSLGRDLISCAGISPDQGRAAILVSSFKSEPKALTLALRNLPWAGKVRAELLVLDEKRNLEPSNDAVLDPDGNGLRLHVPSNGVCLVWLNRH